MAEVLPSSRAQAEGSTSPKPACGELVEPACPEPVERVEGLTSKSLDAARDLEPVETALRVTYS